MNQVTEKILAEQVVTDDSGQEYPLHSHTPLEQCQLLQEIIHAIRPQVSLEIGFAYGISTLFICEALKAAKAAKHIVFDPYQDSVWKDIGHKNLKEAGYSHLIDFRPQLSCEGLPQLVQQKVAIDFAYLDTSKVFDVLMVDIFYLTKLLNVGGVIALDDCIFPGIRKLCRFMAKHPAYEITPQWQYGQNWAQKELNALFGEAELARDQQLGINANCVTFRKIANDTRNWDWFENF